MQSIFVLFFLTIFLTILVDPVLSDGTHILSSSINRGALRSNEENYPENSNNYMIVYFNQKTSYDSGFQNDKRSGIFEIKIEDSSVKPNDSFKIEKGAKIEIHFSSHVQSLESFFDRLIDPNVINIESIDLSHFYSLEVISTRFMFYECLNLKTIDLSNFSPNSLTNMESIVKD